MQKILYKRQLILFLSVGHLRHLFFFFKKSFFFLRHKLRCLEGGIQFSGVEEKDAFVWLTLLHSIILWASKLIHHTPRPTQNL
jgi:hypothetical protein